MYYREDTPKGRTTVCKSRVKDGKTEQIPNLTGTKPSRDSDKKGARASKRRANKVLGRTERFTAQSPTRPDLTSA